MMKKYIILLILLGFLSHGYAQEEAPMTVETFTVGIWQAGQLEAQEFPSRAQNWCALQAKQFLPGLTLASFEGSDLVQRVDLEWTLHTYWQQGNQRLNVRFELWTMDKSLVLPTVGAYQACICTDCSAVDFDIEPRSCVCVDGDGCMYLMGETLH